MMNEREELLELLLEHPELITQVLLPVLERGSHEPLDR